MVTAENEQADYVTRITNGAATVFSDATKGKGGTGHYFRPHDLLCAAYASCLNITARMLLEKLKIRYNRIAVTVDLDRSRVGKAIFYYRIDIDGKINPEIEKTVLSELNGCPVKRTLSGEIEFCRMPE